MRVLWVVRDDLDRHPGGDTTQIRRTAAALGGLGVRVEFASDAAALSREFDLAHLFHVDRTWENLPVCRRIRAIGLPAVLSTIHWPADEFDRGGRVGVQGMLARALGGHRYQTLRGVQQFALRALNTRSLRGWDPLIANFFAAVRFILETARVILPNSAAERDVLIRRFGIARPAVIVPNAVDAVFAGAAQPPEQSRHGVLCVGRIEPRKNQLALIEAMRGMEEPLTLVGRAGRFYGDYAKRCRRAAGARVSMLDWQPLDRLAAFYAAARVHACVSWYETPGLASLEAALCGCRLVVTPGGCTREYFGDDAHYASPDDPASIRAAVESALRAPPSSRLSQRVRSEYNWPAAARATLSGYERALRGE